MDLIFWSWLVGGWDAGTDEQTGALFSYLKPETLVSSDHPLRAIRPLVNAALERLSPQLYAPSGRVSIAPEKLLRSLLLQACYGMRSERQLIEQVTYNMLFRWFVGLSMDAPVLLQRARSAGIGVEERDAGVSRGRAARVRHAP